MYYLILDATPNNIVKKKSCGSILILQMPKIL
uniref:Uncharacterized protein n=1 Tax=Setaria italica TaxID=4555 RepID=K4AP54_SETIT